MQGTDQCFRSTPTVNSSLREQHARHLQLLHRVVCERTCRGPSDDGPEYYRCTERVSPHQPEPRAQRGAHVKVLAYRSQDGRARPEGREEGRRVWGFEWVRGMFDKGLCKEGAMYVEEDWFPKSA